MNNFFHSVPGLSDLSPQPAEPSWAEAVPAPRSVEVRGTTQSKLLTQTPPQDHSMLRKKGKLPATLRVATYARSNANCLFHYSWNIPQNAGILHFQLLWMASELPLAFHKDECS